MTRQAPYGRRRPPRAAHHAAPLHPSTPLRRHAGRALRLCATAGTAVAGLCLVVGSVALVAAATGPAPATHPGAAARAGSRQQRTASTGGAKTAGPGPAGSRGVLAVISGHGSETTRPFAVGGNGTWTLRWSYSCQASGRRGSFMVDVGGPGSISGAFVNVIGTAGHGASRAYRDDGTHYLAISSDCAWRIRVLGQPRRRRQRPAPGAAGGGSSRRPSS